MRRILLAALSIATGCSAAGRRPFRGPLAAAADSLSRTANLSCHSIPPSNERTTSGIVGACDGLVGDTIVAVLLNGGDSAVAIRRLWGAASTSAPRLGISFEEWVSTCGDLTARSRDGVLVARFYADTGGRSRRFVVTPVAAIRDEIRDCHSRS